MVRTRDIAPGDRLRQRQLRTEALYDVVDVRDDLVRVIVVEAPGLPTGFELRLTAEAVRHMDLVSQRHGR